MTGKYTLVFDGNFWLHKTFFIGQKIKQGKPFNFIDEPEEDKNLLLWKLSVDFAAEIKRFEGVTNRIVYTIDSSSWRKTYHPEAEYKAHRTKSSDIDWNRIYDVHTEFVAGLEKLGVIVSRVKGAEADDLIFAWTSHLNQKGQNAIIISGDNDLLQLVNKDNSSGANTLYYNKFDKDLHVFPGFKDWLDQEEHQTTNDIFNLPLDLISNTKNHLKDIIKMNKMKLDEVNTNDFIFRKILIGDAGDNVSPLHVVIKETKGGPRKFVVTDNHAKQIMDDYKSDKVYINQAHFFNDEYIDQIVSIAKRVIKIEKPLDEIRTKWLLNRDLVYLHKKCIPEKVISDMFSHIEPNNLHAFSALELHSIMDKEKILAGTTYTKDKAESFSESSIFKTAMPKAEPKNDKGPIITDTAAEGFNDDFWKDLLK
jgi:5'-3' exonuclease